jgi:hypothetical protein
LQIGHIKKLIDARKAHRSTPQSLQNTIAPLFKCFKISGG